jgi:hypothetical protein
MSQPSRFLTAAERAATMSQISRIASSTTQRRTRS